MNYLKLLLLCSVFLFQCGKAKTPTLTDLNLLPGITFYPVKEDLLGRWETSIKKEVLCGINSISIVANEEADFEISCFFGYPVFQFALTGNILESIVEDEFEFELNTYTCIGCEGPSSPGGMKRYYNASVSGSGKWQPSQDSISLKLKLTISGHFTDSYIGTIGFKKK